MSFRAYGQAIESGVPMPLKSARRIARQTVDDHINQRSHLDSQARTFWLIHADYWAARNGGAEAGPRELEARKMAKSF
jgi:hypothetical protein